MRIPFPTSVPAVKAAIFTMVLVIVQLAEGTDPRYSALTFTFFMLSVFAFNTAGGFSRPSGGYIFFFAVLAVELGTVYKAFLGQAAQTGLQQPLLLMSAHVGIMAGMLLAAYVSRRVATSKDGIAAVLNVRTVNYTQAAIGCLVVYMLLWTIADYLPGGGGQVLHAIMIINPFMPLSILLGTIGAVRDSGGRSSINLVNGAALLYSTYIGILSFSKQGMFLPFTCWVVGVAWARFQLRLLHIIVIIVLCVIGQTVLTPLSQVARNDVLYGSMDERLGIAMGYLSHISDLRRAAYSKEAPPDFDWRMLYYGKEQGIWDRLSMLPNDSVLVSFSDEGHYFGYKAIRYYFENWVPHIIDPHKLEGINVGGNAYMHEMGGLAEADNTTGISFSATAEAYHIDGWRAIAFVSPLIYMLLFITTDFVAGDNRRQPFGLLLTLNFAHVAPETGLGGAISATWLTNIGVILAIVVCGYIAPIFGLLLSGKRSSRAALPDRARLPRRLPESLPGSALQGS